MAAISIWNSTLWGNLAGWRAAPGCRFIARWHFCLSKGDAHHERARPGNTGREYRAAARASADPIGAPGIVDGPEASLCRAVLPTARLRSPVGTCPGSAGTDLSR